MRVAVLSDIHANLVALEAVLSSLGSVDAIWHLGDVVGYGPEPDGVVARLRESDARGVRGNHDAAATGALGIEYFNPDARRAIEWTRQTIADETRHWLDGLPDRLEEGDFSLVHGSPREPIWEYVTSTAVARENLAAFDTPYCLHGHTHVPVLFRASARTRATEAGSHVEALGPTQGAETSLDERRALINPGSVGQPRDGIPDASYAILDTERRRVRWARVPYDVGATQAAMRAANLPPRLVTRLELGM